MVGVYDLGVRGPRSQPSRRGRTPLRSRRPVSVNVISDGITRLPILEGEISHVEIPRPKGVSLGVTIVGGADTPLRCVVVQEVFPDGLAAQDGRLQPGDQIIEVDGVDVTTATHLKVCQELRKSEQPTLKLGVYRERIQAYQSTPPVHHPSLHSTYSEDCVTVTLWREQNRPLGIKVGSNFFGIYVATVMPHSVAALDGRLRPHDRILAINGHDVSSYRLDAAARLLERSKSSVTFSVLPGVQCGSDGSSICSTCSDCSSSHSSPRIVLPTLDTGEDGEDFAGGTFVRAVPVPFVPVYDAEDNESTRSEMSSSGEQMGQQSPCPKGLKAWGEEQASISNGLDDRWPPLPQKPKLARKIAVIKKESNESLGMRIGGGVSSNEGDTPIYIANINNNGPAGKCSIVKKGDVLLAVNGQSLLGLTHCQAVAQLKATADLVSVTLSLLDGPETSPLGSANFVPSWLYWQKLPRPLQISRSVVLQRNPGSSLGFSIVGGTDPARGSEPIHVLLVVASSPAAVDGKLRCGDRILAVDSYSLEGVSHSTAVGLLKQAGQRVHLEVVSWLGTEL